MSHAQVCLSLILFSHSHRLVLNIPLPTQVWCRVALCVHARVRFSATLISNMTMGSIACQQVQGECQARPVQGPRQTTMESCRVARTLGP